MRLASNHPWLLRRLAPALLLATFIFIVTATPAHAWFDIGKIAADAVLDGILALLGLINFALGEALVAVQKGLLWILSLKITAGVTVVRFAWSLIRDLVNMVFILLFIAISFATIFNVAGFFKQYYWKQALVPLLIGAIVLNYSLAIGQAIALLSNRVASIAVGILPNPGDMLIRALQPNATTLALKNEVGPSSAKIVDTTKTLTAAEDAHYKKCLNEEKTVLVEAGIFWDTTEKVRKSVGDCNLEILEARNAVGAAVAGRELSDSEKAALESHQEAYTSFSGSVESKSMLIVTAIFNVFMLVIIICCLLTAFVFLAVRIMALWALLALSPLAWMGYALPGKGPFHQWWTTFIAWNVFGPLYIFTLIPGMNMLIRQGEFMTALNRAGAGGAGGLVQIVLFQGFALLIFVGGLGLALKSSFAGAVKGTAFAGAALQKFGTFDSMGGGMKAWSQIGRRTGATAAAQARWEKTKQQAGDLASGARARMGRFGRTEEEALAQARERRGVRGGAEEVESLRAKRINAEKGNLEQAMKIARAKAEAEGAPFDEAVWLEDYKDSSNPDIKLAAREMLTSRGKIGADEMVETAEDYAKISPLARQAYVERASTRLTEKAGKKGPEGFKDATEAIAALDSGLMNDRQKMTFLGTLQRNQPLIAAEIAMNPTQTHYPGKNAAKIIAENFSGMSNTDIAKLMERGATNSLWLGAVGTPDRDRMQGSLKARMKRGSGATTTLTEHYYEVIAASPAQQAQLDNMIT